MANQTGMGNLGLGNLGPAPAAKTTKADYLNLPEGRTTFTIDFINMFRFVHFVNDSNGRKRKMWCSPHTCTHCNNGNRRCMRLSMAVIHNGDTKTLEVGSALGHQIINKFSIGDVITIERIGTGFSTRYNIIGLPPGHTKTAIMQFSDEDKEEAIKELMYDVQRSVDYDEKYDFIKDFARKY